uniref:DinB family protein n=1 Tax=Pedobacter sp. TaxID=1411316 RepID=UPI003D7FB068
LDSLKHSVDGLSAAQLQYKPAADKWSVSQCLEHIVLAERMIFSFARQGMDKPAQPERRKEIKMKDEDLIKGINDRSHKAKASKEMIGTGKYTNAAAALQELENDRKNVLAYLDTVAVDNLRNHVSESPFGPLDGYQSFLFIPGHTSRHTLQIIEIKADPNFPKQ